MIGFKKIITGGMLALVLLVPTIPPVAAATPDYSMLTPEARAALLTALMKQLVYLQEKLALIKAGEDTAASIKTQPSPVTADDFTKGAVDANIKIVTFTDFDCPFCKQFHTTLSTVAHKYPDVSITYRHFPLEQLHPNAKKLSIAAECVGQIGGDKAFYTFVDSVFNLRNINDQTDMSKLAGYAQSAGIDPSAFATCRTTDKAQAAVETDMKEGKAISVAGTPQSFVFKNGEIAELSGAQPLVVVEQIIENLLE